MFAANNLVVSRSVYDNNPNNVIVGAILPPNCAATMAACGASTGAPYDGTYPYVWNNNLYDSSFGVTAPVFLDQITPFAGKLVNTLVVPNSLSGTSMGDQLVTSFSSKSELGLHLSADSSFLTFVGYVAPVDVLDVSNSNTPGAVDLTNPVGENYLRGVAQVDKYGNMSFTETNAYSGNNGRAAILENVGGANSFFTAGNAGNGTTPQPNGIILGAGAQIFSPYEDLEQYQSPGTPTPVASFSVTELGDKADKIGKDESFRGMTVYNNILYFTKGSGSNGVNTVYFVDTTGSACPKGVGLPSASATLPTAGLAYILSNLQSKGLPNNMCVLAGFPTTPNKTATTLSYPFGLWFANPTTLYVADEGDGYAGGTDLYTHAAAQTTAGLQKWVYNSDARQWTRVYTLQIGLNLGVPYTVSGYPSGTNPATSLPWSPATDGLRNIYGTLNGEGTVVIWAITSTVSGNGDQGADPNELLGIVDNLANTDPSVAASESFFPVYAAGFGQVLRGVCLTPGSNMTSGSF